MAKTSPGFKNKKILLGVTGSIAIYKACDLTRALKEQGADVFCLMSKGAQKFIAPLTFGALSGNPVATDVWNPDLWKMAHISLSEVADLFIIAPASTNCLARLAHGLADDVITATASATKIPILLAPAMHEQMWQNPATQANVRRLKEFGYHFIGPEQGKLLGKTGWGRMSEPQTILDAARKILQ